MITKGEKNKSWWASRCSWTQCSWRSLRRSGPEPPVTCKKTSPPANSHDCSVNIVFVLLVHVAIKKRPNCLCWCRSYSANITYTWGWQNIRITAVFCLFYFEGLHHEYCVELCVCLGHVTSSILSWIHKTIKLPSVKIIITIRTVDISLDDG